LKAGLLLVCVQHSVVAVVYKSNYNALSVSSCNKARRP